MPMSSKLSFSFMLSKNTVYAFLICLTYTSHLILPVLIILTVSGEEQIYKFFSVQLFPATSYTLHLMP
jgi:hypothetical protein